MRFSLAARVVVYLLCGAASLEIISAQAAKTAIRFSRADPIMVDDDTVADASAFAEVELSEGFDLISNQFGSPGDRTPMRALNVNTIDLEGTNPASARNAPEIQGRFINSKSIPKITLDSQQAPNSSGP
jgi:hypothetical protein